MANAKKKEYLKVRFRGLASYPKLHIPFFYDKKLEKSVESWSKGKFQIDVIVDPSDAAYVAMKDAIRADAIAAGLEEDEVKYWPWKAQKDKATKKKTGKEIVSLKMYGQTKEGQKRRVPLYDAKNNPLPKDFRLTSGSEIIVLGAANPFKELGGGVSLLLNGVQVVKYIPFVAGNPGFEELGEEDGFEYDDADADTSEEDDADADEAEDDADF
jgi:hypothetical protein